MPTVQAKGMRKKRRRNSRPKSPASKINKTKTRPRGNWRLSGIAVVVLMLAIVGCALMYSWASLRVQTFLQARNGNQSGILSSPSVFMAQGSEASDFSVGDIEAADGYSFPARLSRSTWRRILLSHGYNESAAAAAKTFRINESTGEVALVQRDDSKITIDVSGRIFAIKDAHNTPVESFRLEAVPLGDYQGSDERKSVAVPLNAFSAFVPAAAVAVEDERFRQHMGIDLIGIGRALIANISAGGWVQGGSTLTQQLAKNLFLSSERSLLRKFKELFLSLALEQALSKDELLELYLNEVYLGSETGNAIRGIPAAARWLFNKSPGALSLSESALLAGMIQAPAINNPRKHPSNAEARRKVVLQRLLSNGMISQAQWQTAITQQPHIYVPATNAAPLLLSSAGLAPFVAAALKNNENTERENFEGTARVTTILPPFQRCAEQAVLNAGQQLARRLKRRELGQTPQMGLVVLDVAHNNIVALVGGTNFALNQRNHVIDISRQFGSTVKPFIYLRAFEHGITLASRLEDEPLSEGNWHPENFDQKYRGVVTARYALENSLNLPTIRLAKDVGLPLIANTFAEFQIVPKQPDPYPALAIGAIEGTLLNLTNAYAALARGGAMAKAQLLVARAAEAGEPRQIADPRAVFLVTNALQGVIQRGTARGLNAGDDFPSIAGKTGTSDSARDAWFVGFTPSHAIGVWIGYDDNRPLGLTGGGSAAPIAGEFLRCASELMPKTRFSIPPGVVLRPVDNGETWLEQQLSAPVKEFFIEDREVQQEFAPPKRDHDSSIRSWFRRWGL